jgi:hypothetical protein
MRTEGFVDGTTIPIFQRPGFDGETFFNCKKQYLMNAQIVCDCDRFITYFISGWPGSCGDSKVYQRMQLHQNPSQFFDQGKSISYLILLLFGDPLLTSSLNGKVSICLLIQRTILQELELAPTHPDIRLPFQGEAPSATAGGYPPA